MTQCIICGTAPIVESPYVSKSHYNFCTLELSEVKKQNSRFLEGLKALLGTISPSSFEHRVISDLLTGSDIQ